VFAYRRVGVQKGVVRGTMGQERVGGWGGAGGGAIRAACRARPSCYMAAPCSTGCRRNAVAAERQAASLHEGECSSFIGSK
jgi:hypothetical protein